MKNIVKILSVIAILLLAYHCSEENGVISGDKTDGGFSPELSLDGGGGYFGGSGGGNNDTSRTDTVEPGQITAAEWNDLVEWDFWKNLGQNKEFTDAMVKWNFDPSERYSFVVNDRLQRPVTDCAVVLKDMNGNIIWKARTDNEGKAELWLNLNGGEVSNPVAEVTWHDEVLTIVDPKEYDLGINEVTLSGESTDLRKADILFVVDATGSMGDEIQYLKSELLDVVTKASQQASQLDLRTGAVFYRDEGDEYLTRVSPFSAIPLQTIGFIKDQEANGGGDYEEAVHTALNTAITQLSWSSTARTRLLFLLLDAPPHHTNPISDAINDIIKAAAEKGIKIIPISASGINKDTEFLFRFFATSTNGTYVFITNDSGIGGEHIEATVGEYEVEFLNDLIVRLITKYTL